jgi:beta-N-acetylhexosaminidase
MRGATLAAGGVVPGAIRALAAGADLLTIGARADAALIERVADGVVNAIADGQLPRHRVEQAAGRATDLAAWARAAGTTDAADPAGTDGDLGYRVARRAVRVEGVLTDLGGPLVVHLVSSATLVEGRIPWGLGPHLAAGGTADNRVRQLRLVAAEAEPAALREVAGARPIVFVARHLHRLPGARDLVETLAADHPVVVVEMGWPSPWRPAGARAFVSTFGASHANGRAAAEILGIAG